MVAVVVATDVMVRMTYLNVVIGVNNVAGTIAVGLKLLQSEVLQLATATTVMICLDWVGSSE